MNHEHARPGGSDRQDGHGLGQRGGREVPHSASEGADASRSPVPGAAGRTAGEPEEAHADDAGADDRPNRKPTAALDGRSEPAEQIEHEDQDGRDGEDGRDDRAGRDARDDRAGRDERDDRGEQAERGERGEQVEAVAAGAPEGEIVAPGGEVAATGGGAVSRGDEAVSPRSARADDEAEDEAEAEPEEAVEGVTSLHGGDDSAGSSDATEGADPHPTHPDQDAATVRTAPKAVDAGRAAGGAAVRGEAVDAGRKADGAPDALGETEERATPNKPAALQGPAAAKEQAGAGARGDRGLGLDGDLDEQALRSLLQGAVRNLEPAPESLDHLRRAVPARRTRRRQVVVGAVAAVVLGGAAIPALARVTAIGDATHSRPANAASSERTPDPITGGHHGERGPSEKPKQPAKKEDKEKEKGGKKEGAKEKPAERQPPVPQNPAPPNPSSTLAATSPTCVRDQLGDGGSSVGVADAEGRVYGSFRVVNTSADPCSVDGSGVVGAVAQGAANPAGIQVVDHTAGDPATELPPPSATAEQLILQPGQAYEVQYAWIPTPGGGGTGCANNTSSPSPSPTPEEPQKVPAEGEPATDVPGDTAGTGDSSSTGGGGGSEEPAPPASVVISHTPDAGDPAVASATVPEACSGTVYHTGALAGR